MQRMTELLKQFASTDMSEYSLKRFINRTLKLDTVKRESRLLSILPSHTHQVIIGLLLSDGSIERPVKTGGARLSVILGINTLPYLNHLYELFEPMTDSGITHVEVENKKSLKSYITVRFKNLGNATCLRILSSIIL
jgi:hypothetical protein